MTGPYEATGAYRPDALAQLENTEPQWSDAPKAAVRADDVIAFARDTMDLQLDPWQEQYLRAVYEGKIVQRSRRNGLTTLRQVIAEYERAQQGGLGLGIAFIITLIGLFLFGLLQSGRHPDMRVVAAAAIVGALVLFVGVCITGYRRQDRQGAARTDKIEGRVQQSTSTEHFLDGA